MSLYVSFDCESCENENCTGKGLKPTVYKCDGYKHKQTNADRIRNMTDDELAKFISGKARGFGEEYEGYMSALDWLKEESDGE